MRRFRVLLALLAMALAAPSRAQPLQPAPDQPLNRACAAAAGRNEQLAEQASRTALAPMRRKTQEDLGARAIPDGSEQELRIGRSIDLGVLLPVVLVDMGPGATPRIREAAFLSAEAVADTTSGPQTSLRVAMPMSPQGWPWQQARLIVAGCARDPAAALPAGSGKDAAAGQPFIAAAPIVYSGHLVSTVVTAVLIALAYLGAAAASPGAYAARQAPPGAPAHNWLRKLGISLNPVKLTQDVDGHGSLSRLQILFFTMIVGATLLYIMCRVGFLSNISSQVLLLLGVSGIGSAAAQAVSSSRQPAPAGAAAAPGTPVALDPGVRPWLIRHGLLEQNRVARWRDLLTTAGEFDVFKFQMLIFSAVTGIWILLAGFNELAALSIPDNLMILLGISQLVYVGGKAVITPDCGPVNAAARAAERTERDLLQALQGQQRPPGQDWRSWAAGVAPAATEAYWDAFLTAQREAEARYGAMREPRPDALIP